MICQEKAESVLRTREKFFFTCLLTLFICFPTTTVYYTNDGDDYIVWYSRLFYIAQFITWCLTKRKNRRHLTIFRFIFSLFKLIKGNILWKWKWKLIIELLYNSWLVYSSETKHYFSEKLKVLYLHHCIWKIFVIESNL